MPPTRAAGIPRLGFPACPARARNHAFYALPLTHRPFYFLYPALPLLPLQVQAFFQEICGPAYAHAAVALGHAHHMAALATAAALPSPAGGSPKPSLPRNILSFGDSIHERSAIHKVTSTLGGGVRTKSIKFVERPTVEQLKRQVDLVTSCFDAIVGHGESLDLMLTIHLLYQ